ncbi:MAG: hypothetical protein HY817_04205 [Candidatus Abawacabacteria bacterium]|nr:hypothetical protein [Candidatus Abawacabacteria bacterium]
MQDFFIIDDVKVFGRKVDDVAIRDIDNIVITQESLLHVVRHFSQLSQQSRKSLLEKKHDTERQIEVTEKMIDELLHTAGSKFHPQLQDLHYVLSCLLSYTKGHVTAGLKAPWIEFSSLPGEYYTEIHFTITSEQKEELGLSQDEFIGTLGAVPINEENIAFVQPEQRGAGDKADDIIVNIIKELDPPLTDTITIGLAKNPETLVVRLTTIFTSDGKFSPLFPNAEKQSPEEFAYNKQWWEQYAFFKS